MTGGHLSKEKGFFPADLGLKDMDWGVGRGAREEGSACVQWGGQSLLIHVFIFKLELGKRH